MNVQYYHPSKLLQPFIRKYTIIESGPEMINRVVPETSLVMAFRFKGLVNYIAGDNKQELPSLVISGLQKNVRLINYTPQSGTLLVLFKSTGAASFFKAPLHELFASSIPLDNIFRNNELSAMEEQLALAATHRERIDLVENFLLSKFIQQDTDKLVEAAVQKIHESNGLYKAKELAGSLYISQDAFEKRFRKVVGSSPKQYSSIVRMKAVLKQAKRSSRLYDLAIETGFYDPSHFNKEFKIFTGQSPTDYFKNLPAW